MTFRRQVNAKKTSWKKLIDAGLVLEARRGKFSVAAKAIKRLSQTK